MAKDRAPDFQSVFWETKHDRALAGLTQTQRTTLIRALEAIQKNLADRG